jgi:hypothetical protein
VAATYVDSARWPDNVGNMGHRGTGGGTEVQHLRAGLHVDSLQATEDTSGKLTPAASSQYVEHRDEDRID